MNEREAILLQAFERAGQVGLVREYSDFEAFAADVLKMIDQPDTPVNRAKLQLGSDEHLTALMAGPERGYSLAVIPPTPFDAAGSHFFIEVEAERILFLVVSAEDEERFIAAMRARAGTGDDSAASGPDDRLEEPQ